MSDQRNNAVRRADEFVELYNQLADHLAGVIGESTRMPFYELVERAARDNRLIQREISRIRKYGDLRNAIVHGPDYPRALIAEPTENALDEFRAIVGRIVSPRLLSSFQKAIRVFTPDQRLTVALQYMRDNDFSQVVVRKPQQLALLTTEGVTKWLGLQCDLDSVDVAEVTVADALKYDIPNSFKLLRRDDTLDDAQEAFAAAIEHKRPRLFAIVITQNGKAHESPLGIVTPWDVLLNLA